MKPIDLNADVGESYGRFQVGQDEALMPYLTSCNIACGYHGGDPLTIHRTIELAMENDVKIGAHPSYPDLMGFGRRRMHLTSEELSAMIIYQFSALKGITEMLGGRLHHVKPHGALNNHMMADPKVLETVINAVHQFDPELIIYVPYSPGSSAESKIWVEVFADRSYEADFQLTPRSIPGSLLDTIEAASDHLENLVVNRSIAPRQGVVRPIDFDTICIHGDNDAALSIAQWIRDRANEKGIQIGQAT